MLPPLAILVTWHNMDNTALPDFIARAKLKYKDRFHRLYFDDANLREELRTILAKKDVGVRLVKIYIAGHGGAGLDNIRDNTQTQVKTLSELAELLRYGLLDCPTSKDTSYLTRVDMISCLFGRSPDGLANSSSA